MHISCLLADHNQHHLSNTQLPISCLSLHFDLPHTVLGTVTYPHSRYVWVNVCSLSGSVGYVSSFPGRYFFISRYGEVEGLKININHIKTTTATTRWAPILIKFSLHLNTIIDFQPPKTTTRLFKIREKTRGKPTHHGLPDTLPAPCNFTGPTAPAEELREPWSVWNGKLRGCVFSTCGPKKPGFNQWDAMKTSPKNKVRDADPLAQ